MTVVLSLDQASILNHNSNLNFLAYVYSRLYLQIVDQFCQRSMSTLLPSALSILSGILIGAKESLTGITAIRKIHIQNEKLNKRTQRHHRGNPHTSKQSISVYQRLTECCCLNIGVFGSSIIIFNWLLLPYMYELMFFIFGHEKRVKGIWSWLNPILQYTFGAFWVLPLFMLSRLVNAFWFQDIAECTFRGRSQSVRSVSIFIADTLFSLIIQALFLIQAVIAGKVSYVGQVISILHLSLLYSLYSFEYKWFNNGKLSRSRCHIAIIKVSSFNHSNLNLCRMNNNQVGNSIDVYISSKTTGHTFLALAYRWPYSRAYPNHIC